jgi:outer membrane protein assembly factor BamB
MYHKASFMRNLFAGVALIALASAVLAGDWPRFRGPNGAGIAMDKGIPIHFTEKEGVLWKTAIPGAGNSSPIVSGDRIFLQTAGNGGGERQLVCIDAASGKILWSKSEAGGSAKKHQKNSFASSTPATDGERVYANFWDGENVALFAFDFHGKELWKHDLGSFTSQHGAGASPIVFDDVVILNNDQDGTANLVALKAKSGEVAWEAARRPYRACYSTPFILASGTKAELIVASTGGITSYEPHTGKVNWDWIWDFNGTMPLRTVGSPVYSNGLIVAASGDGSGARHLVAVRVNEGKPELAWELKKRTPYVPTVVAYGDHLFFVNDDGVAGCLLVQTGEAVWIERLSGAGSVSASPILIDGKIYAISEDGTVYVYKAAGKFEQLAKNALGEPVIASPAVANNCLFVRGKSHLYCIGKSSAGGGKANAGSN